MTIRATNPWKHISKLLQNYCHSGRNQLLARQYTPNYERIVSRTISLFFYTLELHNTELTNYHQDTILVVTFLMKFYWCAISFFDIVAVPLSFERNTSDTSGVDSADKIDRKGWRVHLSFLFNSLNKFTINNVHVYVILVCIRRDQLCNFQGSYLNEKKQQP